MVAGFMNIEEAKIKSFTREKVGVVARGFVSYVCKAMCGKTAKEVSKYFHRSEPVLSKAIRKVECELAEKKNDTEKLIKQIAAMIKKNYRPCLVRETK